MNHVIESGESHPQCFPKEGDLSRRKTYSKSKGWVSHKDVLDLVRTSRPGQECHSDGFLAIHNVARACECGGCATYQDGYICPRCGEYVDTF